MTKSEKLVEKGAEIYAKTCLGSTRASRVGDGAPAIAHFRFKIGR